MIGAVVTLKRPNTIWRKKFANTANAAARQKSVVAHSKQSTHAVTKSFA